MSQAIQAIRQLVGSGRYLDAIAACDRALAEESGNLDVLIEKALLLASPMPEVANPDKAVTMLRDALASQPSEPRLLVALAQAYEGGVGDYALAAKTYREALEAGANDPAVHLAIALLAGAPGSGIGDTEAETILREGLIRAPSDWQLHRQLGLVHWRGGRLADAAIALGTARHEIGGADETSKRQIEAWLGIIERHGTYEEGMRLAT